MHPQHWLWGQI